MSARRIDRADSLSTLGGQTGQKCLSLTPEQVRIHKNGVEFRSETAIVPWTEMTVSLQLPKDKTRVNCTGVVIACAGNRLDGFSVSMVFTSLTPQSQARLNSLAYS